MDSMIVFCQQVESTGHGYCDTQYRGYSSRRNEEQRDTHQPNHHSSYEGTKDSQGFVLVPFISHELTKANIFVISLMILDSTVRLISLELYNVKPGKSVPKKNSENINTDFCTYTVLKLLKMAKGDPSSPGYGDAGSASSREPWASLLPALLHIRRSRRGTVRQTWWVVFKRKGT